VSDDCPECGAPLEVESGLLYCRDCDSYHGEADPADEEA
jgi:uncharacterized Zn finger protein (UPF0148 family)